MEQNESVKDRTPSRHFNKTLLVNETVFVANSEAGGEEIKRFSAEKCVVLS